MEGRHWDLVSTICASVFLVKVMLSCSSISQDYLQFSQLPVRISVKSRNEDKHLGHAV